MGGFWKGVKEFFTPGEVGPGKIGPGDYVGRLIEDPSFREQEEKVHGKDHVQKTIDNFQSYYGPR
ncbi:hypothetical protein [Vibrio vulnificus]|uniref:Uncharacterized protein n=1 Tax=Vibrio vulnificus TaxID=672 RepID=A0AAW4HH41_VIBVL|nr:hypothetical protein [Vibrio vulnificus]ELA3117922.1 hypothetical protein [Vibrio vulnificus]ELV8768330.1 hypothetical protein [Vibrio vulnificus]MBN8124533.1 hypothetical protein [Vibrio vulnificus]